MIESGTEIVHSQSTSSVFSKDNLTAWCIVPFDAKHRTPHERASMLHRLGFKTLAYDWRDEHIPEFDEEVTQLGKYTALAERVDIFAAALEKISCLLRLNKCFLTLPV